MPAIASLKELRAAEKDLLEAKDLGELKQRSRSGVVLAGRIFVSYGWRKEPQNN